MPYLTVDGVEAYYEVHGEGEVALCMGGWGTFCHGKLNDVPRYIRENFRVVIFDYPGLGESRDDLTVPASTSAYANTGLAVLDDLEVAQAHIVGMVGLGACVGQKMALSHPDRVKSLVMTGTWARPDALFADQLQCFLAVHRNEGFAAFQKLCAAFSFDAAFYEANRDRILGSEGAWSALNGHVDAHARLIEACLSHDAYDYLGSVACPTFVVHANCDAVTPPRLTQPLEDRIPLARGYYWEGLTHIIAGRDQKAKFDQLLAGFYESVTTDARAPMSR